MMVNRLVSQFYIFLHMHEDKLVNHCHAGLFPIDISTEMCRCWLQWIIKHDNKTIRQPLEYIAMGWLICFWRQIMRWKKLFCKFWQSKSPPAWWTLSLVNCHPKRRNGSALHICKAYKDPCSPWKTCAIGSSMPPQMGILPHFSVQSRSDSGCLVCYKKIHSLSPGEIHAPSLISF